MNKREQEEKMMEVNGIFAELSKKNQEYMMGILRALMFAQIVHGTEEEAK